MLLHMVLISSAMLILSLCLCYYALADFTAHEKQENISTSCRPQKHALAQSGSRYE